MKQPIMLASGLTEFHWNDLADVHLDVTYCRQRFVHAVNQKISSQKILRIEDLDRLAKVDELFKEASDALERAKTILFNFCYDDHQDLA